MSDGITFEYYQDSDAPQVVDLLNRNRFHSARHKTVTTEDYRFLLRSRSYHFIVLAKKNGTAIATVAAYPSSDQHVAKAHQVYVGSFLIDNQYRLSYSIIMGLFDMLMKGLMKTDYKEILSTVRPENEASYNLMLKFGFVILNKEPNGWGRYMLSCFSPALSLFGGADSTEVNSNTMFSNLPIVNRKEARKFQTKERLYEKYIECDYKLNGKQITLLFDVVNAKIDGAISPKYMKLYPDFTTPGQYIAESLHKTKSVHASIKLIMEPETGMADVHYDFDLEPGATKVITCSKDVKELQFLHTERWYHLHPNLFLPEGVKKEPILLESFASGNFIPWLDPATGFLSILEGKNKLFTLPWPCAVFPYMEGLFAPRIKDLAVEYIDGGLMVTEKTDTYRLSRTFLFTPDPNPTDAGGKFKLTTTLIGSAKEPNFRPISQIYANEGVQGYSLTTTAKEMVFGASQIKHQGFEYSDYPYWDTKPELFADAPLKSISLKYKSAVVDIDLDQTNKPIVYAPLFTSTLSFDKEKLPKEQVLEQLDISYRMEEK